MCTVNIHFQTVDCKINNLSLSATDVPTCSPANTYCCNTVAAKDSTFGKFLARLLNITNVLGDIGLTCTVPVVGGAVQTCSNQNVCCSGTKFNGLIAIGCNNIFAG